MLKSVFLWILAVVITVVSAVYQRMTGPTYPFKGEARLESSLITYKLPRSHAGSDDCNIHIEIADTSVTGNIGYRRYKTDDPWSYNPLIRDGKILTSSLPNQPMAGKLVYQITLIEGSKSVRIPDKPVIIRFRGDVPLLYLIPHIIFMFAAMLISNRAGLESLRNKGSLSVYTHLTCILLLAGGFIFGGIVQHYAFGVMWSGFPLGMDLTDNKTLVAMIGWLIALYAVRRQTSPRRWVFLASILMLAIFFIPHSLFGSELDYSKLITE